MENPDLRPGRIPRPNHERLASTAEIDMPFWLLVASSFPYIRMREDSILLYMNQPITYEEGAS